MTCEYNYKKINFKIVKREQGTFMNYYCKKVLFDPELLREKLRLYLKTPKSVESYAQACEKFLIPVAKKICILNQLGVGGGFTLAGEYFYIENCIITLL